MAFTFNTLFMVLVGCSITVYSVPLNRVKRETHTNVKQVRAGSSFELECSASGTKPPIFHWLHDDTFIMEGPLDQMSSNIISPPLDVKASPDVPYIGHKTVAKLVIHSAQAKHSGKYACVGDSSEERVHETYHIEVVDDITSDETEKRSGDVAVDDRELRIYQWTDQVMQVEGEPIYVVCRATQGLNRLTPKIQWSIGDKILDDSMPGIKLHDNGDLEVNPVTAEFHNPWDGAGLTCKAIGLSGATVTVAPWIYVLTSDVAES